MRIRDKNRPHRSKKKTSSGSQKSSVGKADSSFKNELTSIRQKEVKQRLDRLLELVDKQGEKLKETLDRKDLISYKKRVQAFLRILQKEFVDAKQSFSWDGEGNVQTHTIINKIDNKLNVLQEMFFQEQADVLDVVSKIDEIRGLLLDLYR